MVVVVERDRCGKEGVERENPGKDDPETDCLETDRRPSLQRADNHCI
jgi:hypothetical protein